MSFPQFKNGMFGTEEYKYFRRACDAFIAKAEVREFVFDKHGPTCANCGATDNLQIDHIKSVWRCFEEKDFDYCNTEDNLQVLCASCNAAKKP